MPLDLFELALLLKVLLRIGCLDLNWSRGVIGLNEREAQAITSGKRSFVNPEDVRASLHGKVLHSGNVERSGMLVTYSTGDDRGEHGPFGDARHADKRIASMNGEADHGHLT